MLRSDSSTPSETSERPPGASTKQRERLIDGVVAGLRHPGLRASLEWAPMTRQIYDQAGQDA